MLEERKFLVLRKTCLNLDTVLPSHPEKTGACVIHSVTSVIPWFCFLYSCV